MQKERAEFAKMMIRSTRPVAKSQKPSAPAEPEHQAPSAQELEDMYGTNECQIEYSQGRKPSESINTEMAASQTKPRARKHIKMTLEDLTAPVSSSKLVDFNKPVPVYPKPFAAFSQTSPSPNLSHQPQKKKIKLASRNSSFSGSSSIFQSVSIPNNLGSSNVESGTVTEFTSNDEFWAWVSFFCTEYHRLSLQPHFIWLVVCR